jgi:hypothetical protein
MCELSDKVKERIRKEARVLELKIIQVRKEIRSLNQNKTYFRQKRLEAQLKRRLEHLTKERQQALKTTCRHPRTSIEEHWRSYWDQAEFRHVHERFFTCRRCGKKSDTIYDGERHQFTIESVYTALTGRPYSEYRR